MTYVPDVIPSEENSMVHNVYTVLVNDRHADPEITVFVDEHFALKYANEELDKYRQRDPEVEIDDELNEDMIKDGWIFFAQIGGEDDYIRVQKTKLRYI
jgi:hypothetical protein